MWYYMRCGTSVGCCYGGGVLCTLRTAVCGEIAIFKLKNEKRTPSAKIWGTGSVFPRGQGKTPGHTEKQVKKSQLGESSIQHLLLPLCSHRMLCL